MSNIKDTADALTKAKVEEDRSNEMKAPGTNKELPSFSELLQAKYTNCKENCWEKYDDLATKSEEKYIKLKEMKEITVENLKSKSQAKYDTLKELKDNTVASAGQTFANLRLGGSRPQHAPESDQGLSDKGDPTTNDLGVVTHEQGKTVPPALSAKNQWTFWGSAKTEQPGKDNGLAISTGVQEAQAAPPTSMAASDSRPQKTQWKFLGWGSSASTTNSVTKSVATSTPLALQAH